MFNIKRGIFAWPVTAFVCASVLAGCAQHPTRHQGSSNQLSVTETFATASNSKPGNASEQSFQFLIVGDRTGGHRPGVFDRAMDKVNQLQPEFVIGVGDLIEGYTESSEQLDKEWLEIERMVGKLDSTFYYVPGNHDISNNTMANLWLERRGPAYYHFVYRNVLFLVINTEDPPQAIDEEMRKGIEQYKKLLKTDPEAAIKLVEEFQKAAENGDMAAVLPANISEQQLMYMQQAIADNPDVRWTFLFMHKPAWRYGSNTFAKLEQSLQGKNYTVVAGHEHYYTHEKRFGQHYIGMGKTGGAFHKSGAGNIDHVAWVSMTEDGPVIATIELSGIHDEAGPPASAMEPGS